MQLLYPFGLLALAGLIIPVLLHLWNVKRGRVLKIGSIALLGENATSSAKTLKITDLLLFILRCLIVILISFILAQPFYKKTTRVSNHSGWILMDRSHFSETYKKEKKSIDSLLKLGFELHDFNLKFEQFQLGDSLVKSNQTPNLNYLSLLQQLNTAMPKGYSAYIFADAKLKNFEGDLPNLSFKMTWKSSKDTAGVKNWSTSFLGKTYIAKSTSNLTHYTAALSSNPPSLNVLVHDPTNADSKFIRAGLNAIASFTKRPIEVSNWIPNTAAKADVVFWLSEKAISSSELSLMKPGSTLLTYQNGKTLSLNSTINLSEETELVDLKKRIETNEVGRKVLWTDGFGKPLLTAQNVNHINHLYFYSRFNPKWNDLVWNEQFVKALMPIVLGHQNAIDFGFEDNWADQRQVIVKHLLKSNANQQQGVATSSHSMTNILWFLALLLLIIERVLSLSKKQTAYVKN